MEPRSRTGTAARLVHALGALGAAAGPAGRPEWLPAAAVGLGRCLDAVVTDDADARLALPGQQCSAMADAALLEAVASTPDAGLHAHSAVFPLGRALRQLVRADGSVAGRGGQPVRQLQDHDYLPGVTLSALAAASRATGNLAFGLDWDPSLAFYRRRWANVRPWGLLAWHLQAWTAVHRIEPADRYAEFVFALADWAIDRQLRKNGAFLTDMAPVASFHTAVVAEGMADAWSLARRLGDDARARRYESSWWAAVGFASRLAIGPGDVFALRSGPRAVGGVRATESSSELRVDYTSHLVAALVKGLDAGRC